MKTTLHTKSGRPVVAGNETFTLTVTVLPKTAKAMRDQAALAECSIGKIAEVQLSGIATATSPQDVIRDAGNVLSDKSRKGIKAFTARVKAWMQENGIDRQDIVMGCIADAVECELRGLTT